jgi:hypothetical protein
VSRVVEGTARRALAREREHDGEDGENKRQYKEKDG